MAIKNFKVWFWADGAASLSANAAVNSMIEVSNGVVFTPSINGWLEAIHYESGNSTDGSCTLDMFMRVSPSSAVLNLAAMDTDVSLYPRVALHDNTGTAIYGAQAEQSWTATNTPLYEKYPLCSSLGISGSNMTSGNSASITCIWST